MKKFYWLAAIALILSACSSEQAYEAGTVVALDEAHAACISTNEFGALSVPTCDDLGKFKIREDIEVLLKPTDKTNFEKVSLEFFVNGEKKEMPINEYIFPTSAIRRPEYLSFNIFFLSEDNIYVQGYETYETFYHFDGINWTSFNLQESIENNVPNSSEIVLLGVFKISTDTIAIPVGTRERNEMDYSLMKFSTKDYSFLGTEAYSEKDWKDWEDWSETTL